MYSYGSPHMATQKQGDQLERTFSSYVRIQDVVLKTYLGRWTIGRSGERGSGDIRATSAIWWWWIFLSFVIFRFSFLTWHIIICQIPSLYIDCISSLPLLGFLILLHFFAKNLVLFMYMGWLIFFLRFMKLVSAYAFFKYVIQWHHRYYKL